MAVIGLTVVSTSVLTGVMAPVAPAMVTEPMTAESTVAPMAAESMTAESTVAPMAAESMMAAAEPAVSTVLPDATAGVDGANQKEQSGR